MIGVSPPSDDPVEYPGCVGFCVLCLAYSLKLDPEKLGWMVCVRMGCKSPVSEQSPAIQEQIGRIIDGA